MHARNIAGNRDLLLLRSFANFFLQSGGEFERDNTLSLAMIKLFSSQTRKTPLQLCAWSITHESYMHLAFGIVFLFPFLTPKRSNNLSEDL